MECARHLGLPRYGFDKDGEYTSLSLFLLAKDGSPYSLPRFSSLGCHQENCRKFKSLFSCHLELKRVSPRPSSKSRIESEAMCRSGSCALGHYDPSSRCKPLPTLRDIHDITNLYGVVIMAGDCRETRPS
jgi:hypothetical protein